MLGIDPEIVSSSAPGIAAVCAALLAVCVYALASRFSRMGALAATERFVLVAFAAFLCAALSWTFFAASAARDRSAALRALELRDQELSAQASTPGSALGCLDGLAGDSVRSACERALFATPQNVAAATSYVAAQFTLLSDMTAYTRRGGTGLGHALAPLRRALEADPYGFVAQVLAMRGGCTAGDCPGLALLPDSSRVRINLVAQTLDSYVQKYRDAWAKLPGDAGATLADGGPGFMPPDAADRRKVSLNIDFPSAASIPPISIMNPEPKGPIPEEPRDPAGMAQTQPVWTPRPDPHAH